MRPTLVGLGAVVLSFATFASTARGSPRRDSVEDALASGDIDAEDLLGRAGPGRGIMPLARGGETWVSLSGYTRRSTLTDAREYGGLVVLGVALDRIVGHAQTSGLVRAGPTPAPAAPATAPADPSGAEALVLTSRLARSAVSAAWHAAGLGSDDARLDAIVSRARWSALLPETRLRAIRYDDERLYTDASADAPKLRDSAGANLGLEARLTWRFDRLLYADDEPAFERMRLERHDARSRIAARVLEALFHWQRARLELRWAQNAAREAREPMRTRDEIEAALRMMEAEATLDVLTAGWFGTWRAARSPPKELAQSTESF